MLRPVHHVRIEPYGIELEVKDGQTIFRVANEAGLKWPTRCGGARSCTLCTMVVTEGFDNLTKPDDDERLLIAPIARRLQADPIRVRMACTARVRGPLVVTPRYSLGQEPLDDDPGADADAVK